MVNIPHSKQGITHLVSKYKFTLLL